jgi:hypothetical protein
MLYGEFRFAAEELAVAASGVFQGGDFGRPQGAVRLHLKAHAVRAYRTAHHSDDLAVYQRQSRRLLA